MDAVEMREKALVDVVIPTYKPDKRFEKILEKLNEQHHKVNKIIIMNTEREFIDEESLLCKFNNLEIHSISKEEFNHGLTRNRGVSYSEADYVVFMTQDAIPLDKYLVDELLRPFDDQDVYMTYAKQQANKNCKYVEKYIRSFNYPDNDIVKKKEDLETMGIKTIFCSDVCAAYNRKHFLELGEFNNTNFNEDTFFAYKIIMAEKKVYYASCARVIHSHNYSYKEQFRRNFDIGRSQKDYSYIFENIKSESEGIKLVKAAISHVVRHGKWYMIPEIIISSGFKFLGYKCGKNYNKLPQKLVKKWSMNG